MVTKILFPFGSAGFHGQKGNNDVDNHVNEAPPFAAAQTVSMDWKKWQSIFNDSSTRPSASKQLDRQNIAKLRPRDAWKLTKSQLDDYLDWHQQTRLTEKDGMCTPCISLTRIVKEVQLTLCRDRQDHRHLLRLFPLQEIQPRAPVAEEPEEAIDKRYRLIQESCLVVSETPEAKNPSKGAADKKPDTGTPGGSILQHIKSHFLYHYREESELPELARAFYSRAGEWLLTCLTSLWTINRC